MPDPNPWIESILDWQAATLTHARMGRLARSPGNPTGDDAAVAGEWAARTANAISLRVLGNRRTWSGADVAQIVEATLREALAELKGASA